MFARDAFLAQQGQSHAANYNFRFAHRQTETLLNERWSIGDSDSRVITDLPPAFDYHFLCEFVQALTTEVAIVNTHGRILTASKAWQSRAALADLEGQMRQVSEIPELDFLSSDDRTAHMIATSVNRVLSGGNAQPTINFTANVNLRRRRYSLHVAPLNYGSLRGAVVINDDVTEMHDLHRAKKLLSVKLTRSKEQERRRIAQEMHDSTVQDLAAIAINLGRLRHVTDAATQEVLGDVRTILTKTLRDVRTLSYALNPPSMGEGGLVSALNALVHGISDRAAVTMEFKSEISSVRLSDEIEGALYRVVQQALLNIQKHADATLAIVRFYQERNELVLEIEDNGIGIEEPHLFNGGMGIQGIRARIRSIGGTVTFGRCNPGTLVKAIIPLESASG